MAKKQETKPAAAGAGYKEIKHGMMDCDKIAVVSNFRKNFDEKRIKELAENIGKVGVLQPVILREGDILVAGERRLRASMLAGVKQIPFRMLQLTDDEALEVQALENLHRKDLSPIEEARAFKVLLDQKGHTLEQVQDLADRVGKTSSYVYRALRILELPKRALDKIEAGNWTTAHGHQLLRLVTDADRERLMDWLDDGGDAMNADTVPSSLALKEEIESSAKSLKEAIFPTDQEYGKDIACNSCAENSSNQSGLFDGAEKGQCLNPECFERKSAQARKDKVAKALENMPEGVRNLGTKSVNGMGNIQGLTGAKKIDAKEISKAVQKAMEANPKAFAMAILQERYGSSKLEPVLLCTDPTVLGEKAKVPEERQDYERHRYIEEAVEVALIKSAIGKAPKKLDISRLREILKSISEGGDLAERLCTIFGIKCDYSGGTMEKHISGMKEPEIIPTIIAGIAFTSHPYEKSLKALGVDVKTITKTETAEANKAYDAKKAAEAKKPASKKGDSDDDQDGDGE